MKILQISHGFPPNENAGVELYTFYLSQALAQENHEVHVFCREEDPKKEEFSTSEEEIDGLKVTRVVNNLTRIPDPQTYYDNHFFDQVFLEALKRVKPDVVHFQHIIALSANLMKIAKAEGCPVVLTLHDFFLLCHRVHLLKREDRLCEGPRYGLECVSCLDYMYVYKPQDVRTRFSLRIKDTLPFPILKWAKRFLIPLKYLGQRGYEVFHRYRFIYEAFKSPDVILTPSQFVRNLFLKYYPVLRPKTLVLPLGIPPIRDQGQAKERVEGIRFCYIGNILPIKGLHILVDAFRSLPKGKATLTIYGSANPWTQAYCDRLREKASGLPVDFPG
jgi:glycosyltransferase involved in cell wall biosynthesis